MTEYIERDALIEKISSISITIMGVRSGRTLFNEALKSYREAVLKNTKEAPTADVVEVRHGEWIIKPSVLSPQLSVWACSECGTRYTLFPNYKYCPNCGAKMDGFCQDLKGESI